MILTPPPTGGQQILRHALARRWTSIVAGTVAGLVVGVAAAFGVPASGATLALEPAVEEAAFLELISHTSACALATFG